MMHHGHLAKAACAALTLGIALGACGSTGAKTASTSLPVPSSTAATTPTTRATSSTLAPASSSTAVASGAQPCTISSLALSLGPSDNGMSQDRYPLVFRNAGSAACTLRGYAGVSYVTSPSGTQVGAPATRITTSPVSTVTLAPGRSASATLDVVQPLAFDPSSCKITSVLGLRVYPPGQTTAGFISRPGQACSATSLPGHSLTITAAIAG